MIIVVLLRKVTNDNGCEWRGNYGGGLGRVCVLHLRFVLSSVFASFGKSLVLEMKAHGKFSQAVWCVGGDYLQTCGMEH